MYRLQNLPELRISGVCCNLHCIQYRSTHIMFGTQTCLYKALARICLYTIESAQVI